MRARMWVPCLRRKHPTSNQRRSHAPDPQCLPSPAALAPKLPTLHSNPDWQPPPHSECSRGMQFRQSVNRLFDKLSRRRLNPRPRIHTPRDCAASCRRQAPLRSITRRPCATASGTSEREASCGVAKNNNSHALFLQLGPGKRLQRITSISRKHRKQIRQIAGRVGCLLLAGSRSRCFHRGCRSKSRVSSRPEYPVEPSDRSFEFCWHQASISWMRAASRFAAFLVRTNDQDGIVASHVPIGFRPFFFVQGRSGDGLRAAHLVLITSRFCAGVNAQHELPDQPRNRRQGLARRTLSLRPERSHPASLPTRYREYPAKESPGPPESALP